MAKALWTSVVALPLLAGCYQYAAADRSSLAVATPVAVDLSSRGTTDLASKIGNNAVAVQGTVTSVSQSAITIALSAVRRRGENAMSSWNGESLVISNDDIDEVKTRQFSRSRTTLASVALVAASAGIVVGIAKATGGASGSTGGSPPPPP